MVLNWFGNLLDKLGSHVEFTTIIRQPGKYLNRHQTSPPEVDMCGLLETGAEKWQGQTRLRPTL